MVVGFVISSSVSILRCGLIAIGWKVVVVSDDNVRGFEFSEELLMR